MTLTGDETIVIPLPEGLVPEGVTIGRGEVVQFHDHIGNERIWVLIQDIFLSPAEGPAVRGIEYLSNNCVTHGGGLCDHNYVAARSLPLSMLVDPNEDAAQEQAKREAKRSGRIRRSGGPGVCEHCGEPTAGGRFLAGHDAKLKSELQTDAISGGAKAIDAIAESQLRAMQHKEDDPTSSKWWIGAGQNIKADVAKKVKQGDGFMRSRIAQRTGTDPGRMEEIA